MTFSDDLRARLRELFSEELAEHAATMSQRLSVLEEPQGGPLDETLVRELFRSAHSLKGAALAAGYPALESLCHALEAALAGLRDHLRPVDPGLVGLLRQAVDALASARTSVAADEPLDTAAIEAMSRRITDAAAAPAPVPPSAPPLAPAAPEPIGGAAGEPPSATMALRLPAGQLDGLLDQAGEVLVAARTAGLLSDRVDTGCEALAGGRHRWARRRVGLELQLRAGRIDAGLAALEEADRAWLSATEMVNSIADSVRSGQRALYRAAVSFREEARRAGMLPFDVACQGLDGVVRDVARAAGKEARLMVRAADVRVDRLVMSSLREPLIHLVRNAVDHGIEGPELRRRAGKPAMGTVSISADLHGDGVRVAVADDGGGIHERRVRDAATALGLSPEGELTELLFAPGLSTKTAVTLVSGRGVGLDVVRSRVEALGGSVTATSRPGEGTEVQLLVPSSAATLRILVGQVAGYHLGLPLAWTRRVLTVSEDDLRATETGAVLTVSGRAVPVVDLAAMLPGPAELTRHSPMAVVVETSDEWAGLLVDAVIAEEEVVIRPAGPRLAGASLVLGTAVLPDGEPITVLNPSACTRQGRSWHTPADRTRAAPVHPRRVLLAEDSVTTRALERGILEGAGYEVLTAPDGAAAWHLLHEEGADMVLADVTMPNMDGLELCRRIRSSTRFSRLPVILITTLAGEEDRRRGVEAGADAYLVKASFNQETLLNTIAGLL